MKILIIVLVLAVLGGGGYFVWNAWQTHQANVAKEAEQQKQAKEKEQKDAARKKEEEAAKKEITDQVNYFMTAIANNDGIKARDVLKNPVGNPELMSNEALSVAHQKTPITKAQVTEVTFDSANPEKAVATVKYYLGPSECTAKLDMSKGVEGKWLIENELPTIRLNGSSGHISINGQPLEARKEYSVFPGSYFVGSSTDALELVTHPKRITIFLFSAKENKEFSPQLLPSEAGRKLFLQKIKEHYQGCSQKREIQVESCGYKLSVDPGVKIDMPTIRYTVKSWEPIDSALVTAKGNTVYTKIRLKMNITYQGQRANRRGTGKLDFTTREVQFEMDLSQPKPQLKVR